MYLPTARKRKKYGGGFGGAFLRKSDALRNWQDKIQKSFDDEFFYTKDYLSTLASWINGMKLGLNLELKISIPEEEYWSEDYTLYRNDASNFIKAIEDSIARGIGVDDTKNIREKLNKTRAALENLERSTRSERTDIHRLANEAIERLQSMWFKPSHAISLVREIVNKTL